MQYVTDYNLQILVIIALFFSAWCFAWVMPKFGIIPVALFLYMGLNAIWFWLFSHNRYEFLCVSDPVTHKCILDAEGRGMLDAYTQQALHFHAVDSFLKAMLILVPLMLFATADLEKFKRYGKTFFFWLFTVNSLVIIFRFLFGYCKEANTCGGLIGNPSLSASVMVCALPFFWSGRSAVLIALVAMAVAFSGSSVAIGLWWVFLFVFSFRIRHRYAKAVSLVAFIVVPIVGCLLLGRELLFTSGRIEIWKLMMNYWKLNPGNYPFGTGWGTYRVFSINLEDHAQFSMQSMSRWWSWMHNDWLENFLFETGILGFVLAILAYTVALLKSAFKPAFLEPRQPDVTLSLVLYGLFMAMNPALHYPVPMIFGAWLFVLALRRRSLQYTDLAS